MNARQEARLKMYQATEKLCDENASIIVATPAFQTAFNHFKAKIAEIINISQQQATILSGVTADKLNAKQMLCQTTAEIAGIIFAFASATSNNALKQEVNLNYTALFKTKDDQIAPLCQKIYDKATANLDKLADYGITAKTLSNLKDTINNFLTHAPKPHEATEQRKIYCAKLVTLFEEADVILGEQMDRLVITFRAAHPNFVKSYESNRMIIDPARAVTQLKGIVTSQANGRPIREALVIIVEASVRTRTNSVGEYLFKPAPAGKFTIKVIAEGFQPFEENEVEIKMGDVNGVDIGLL